MKHLTKLSLLILLSFNLSCCDDDPIACDVLALADLLIPPVVDLLDQNGVPLIDPQTGQILSAVNELYFNRRTGEYFNSDIPPTQGVIVGDIIEMGTNIFNTFSSNECEVGGNAAASTTAPELFITGPFFNGVLPLEGMPTPPIPIGNRQLTATAFQLVTPGNYSVDFNANAPRNVQEHEYDNNFYFGSNGSYGGLTPSWSFQVEENDKFPNRNANDYSNYNIAPKTSDEMKELSLYKFVNSGKFKEWYLTKINSDQ
ncbi:MAG: hypothetical protein Aureis2KO_20910 [Aureisphaera sp.]